MSASNQEHIRIVSDNETPGEYNAVIDCYTAIRNELGEIIAHNITAAGEPFVLHSSREICMACKQVFHRAEDLKHHKLNVHGPEIYECYPSENVSEAQTCYEMLDILDNYTMSHELFKKGLPLIGDGHLAFEAEVNIPAVDVNEQVMLLRL